MKFRIREENNKFYPERYVKRIIGGYWTSEWYITFTLGNWCGDLTIFEFDTFNDCESFLDQRSVKYHEYKEDKDKENFQTES